MTDEKASRLEEELEALAAYDEIPDEALEQFVEKTEDFFEDYVTPRIQLQTLSQLKDEVENDVFDNKHKKRRALGEKMPPEIENVMKRAYQAYYDQKVETAIALARDAQQTLPNAPEPYELLAEISKSQNNYENALLFSIKTAERARDAVEVWIECYSLAMKLGRVEEAAGYLKKAAQSNTEDIDSLLELYDLLNKGDLNDKRLMNFCLLELTKRQPLNPDYAQEYARFLHDNGKLVDSLEILKNNFIETQKAGESPNIVIANLLGNNYIELGMYDEAINLDKQVIDPPEDFHTNAAIAFIKLRREKEAAEKLQNFFQLDVQEYINAYEEIGQAYVDMRYYGEAAKWYQHMNENGVEKRYEISQCLIEIGNVDSAIEILQELVIDQPKHTSAVGQLYFLMKMKYGNEETIKWLQEHAPEAAKSDDIVLQESDIAYQHGDMEGFVNIGCPLICRVIYDITQLQHLELQSENIKKILGITKPDKMNNFMKKVLKYKRFSDPGTIPLDSEIDFFNMAKTMLTIAYEHDFLEQALVLGGLLVIIREKLDKTMQYHILFLFALTAFKAQHGEQACNVMRTVLMENKDQTVWEFFNLFIQKTPDQEYYAHKFLIRAKSKLQDCAPLQILLGNHSQTTVWFDHAITQYLNVLRSDPDEPIVSLLLASAYLLKAYVRTQKTTRKSILCAYACMKKYNELRTNDFPVECYYNMARFYQHIKMMPQAESLYRKVLETDADYQSIALEDHEEEHDLRYNLKRDAAYNLFLIYKESNPTEARRILKKYLTIE